MPLLSLISGVVSLFKSVAGYFRDKQLVDAGANQERAKRHEEERKTIKRAASAYDSAVQRMRERKKRQDD